MDEKQKRKHEAYMQFKATSDFKHLIRMLYKLGLVSWKSPCWVHVHVNFYLIRLSKRLR